MSNGRAVPRPAQVHNVEFDSAIALFTVSGLITATLPGAAIRVLLTSAVWRLTKPDILTKWLFAGLGAATLAGLRSSLAIGWPWRALLHHWLPVSVTGLTPQVILGSVLIEILAGPAVLVLFEAGNLQWHRTIQGQEWSRYHAMNMRKKALEQDWPGDLGAV
jgi:hypothetical protein